MKKKLRTQYDQRNIKLDNQADYTARPGTVQHFITPERGSLKYKSFYMDPMDSKLFPFNLKVKREGTIQKFRSLQKSPSQNEESKEK